MEAMLVLRLGLASSSRCGVMYPRSFHRRLPHLIAVRSLLRPLSAAFSASSSSRPGQFYRRPLAASCIPFATAEGRQLFKEALDLGFMEAYFDLAPQLRTQVQPSYCGLSALVMVLNSFEMDPGRVWKAPWRWYHEDMLTCCLSSDNLLTHGIILDEFQAIARCNGLDVNLRQPVSQTESISMFRHEVRRLTSQALVSSGTILVACFDRRALKQTGTGHYALVGGYHPKRDLVLLLETAAFKYPPHWAPLTNVWLGMCSIDKETGHPRGYMLMKRSSSSRHQNLSYRSVNDNDASEKSSVSHLGHLPPKMPGCFGGGACKVHREVALSTPRALIPIEAKCKSLPISSNRLKLFNVRFTVLKRDTSSKSATGLQCLIDDWSTFLTNTPLGFLKDSSNCCVSERFAVQLFTSAPSKPCSCVLDALLDYLIQRLLFHRPRDFFFSCLPMPGDASALSDASQIVFEINSSALGRRARLALERLSVDKEAIAWLTVQGPLRLETGSLPKDLPPVSALSLLEDSKLRGSLVLAAFLFAFPYHLVQRPAVGGQDCVADVLQSSEYLINHVPAIATQTCFNPFTPATNSELITLSAKLSDLF